MRKILIAAFAALLFSACQQAPEPEDRVLAVRCGNLIDGISDEALGGKLVLIRNDRIESVDTVGDIPEGA
ncbi:MAG: lipoprotein, partial [Gammaproteobacteria bacterium]|nr:lipoprotein [Gammaproteobacteria bacterium]